jgi:hypothetical protein
MAVGGMRQAGQGGAGGLAPEPVGLGSPLRQRVTRGVGPHPARSLAVRATGLGAAALAVGWYLGPEDGFVPLLVLAAIGGVLGIRWARVVWARRTVGRRIRRMSGAQPMSLGAWRVAGSGYWLRSPGAAAEAPVVTPGTVLAGPAGPPIPAWVPEVWIPPPHVEPATPIAAQGGPVVAWSPPPRDRRVPWVPPGAPTGAPAPLAPPATTPLPHWVAPGTAVPPDASLTVTGTYGWRRATSGVGPFAAGEEVEVLATPAEVWVSGRLVERYRRSESTIEPVAGEALAITAGDGLIRRWITVVPDDPGDLAWVTELLIPGELEREPDAPTADLAPTAQPAEPSEPPRTQEPPRTERAAWDDPRSVTDDGRR